MSQTPLKKGDVVVMHTCMEAEAHDGQLWTCRTDQFTSSSGSQVVFLEDFSGYFATEYLQKVNVEENVRLREENGKLHSIIQQTLKEFKAHIDYSAESDDAYLNLIEKIASERKRFRKTLEFYADETNYAERHVIVDSGSYARLALNEVSK